MDKVIDFTIGADPEFLCVDNRGRTVPSSSALADSNNDEFGCDGNGTTYELRPEPSRNPMKIVNNIRDIFIRQTIEQPKFLGYKWIAGSWHNRYPLGGHVHFGLTKNQIDHPTAVNFLDHYVGLISLLLENPVQGRRRRSDGYGHMGDMRNDHDWGFEYRPMSSWLSSPYVAAAMLCLSKTVMFEVMNNPKFQWHKFALPEHFESVDHPKILAKFPEIWKDITKMHLYQHYKPYLDFIYFLVSNKLSWLSTNSMRDTWGVVSMEPCLTDKVGIDFIWNRFINMNDEPATAQEQE